MGASRITQGMIAQRTLTNIRNQLLRLSDLQNQLGTGLRVNRPSDDPIDARRAVNLRTLIGENQQFLSNIQDARPMLTEGADVLQRVVSIIHRVRELTIQGANETNSQDQLDLIALEINQLLEETVVASNHQTNGRFVFAGTRTLTRAFVETRVAGSITAVTYQGNANAIQIAPSAGTLVGINETGPSAFQNTVDIFQMLIGIRDDLRAGNQTNIQAVRLDELSSALDDILLSESRLGAVENSFNRIDSNTQDFIVQLQGLLSEKIDADFAETMLNFNTQSNAFEAALNAGARIIQPTLLDFLR